MSDVEKIQSVLEDWLEENGIHVSRGALYALCDRLLEVLAESWAQGFELCARLDE